jgi:SulP family sulfate permease
MTPKTSHTNHHSFGTELLKNLIAGLTVSFVAISLGAAFGIGSGRGALAGILSAGIIALITALFGGTRIQTSGPTAPMTAVTIIVVAFAFSQQQYLGKGLAEAMPGVDPERFINLVFLLTGILLLLAAVCRLGTFIQFVPRTVISGFMNGIAILIWVGEVKKLFGFDADGKPFDGSLAVNVSVALAALALAFLAPMLVARLFPRIKAFLPGTLIAILAVTLVVQFAAFDIEQVKTERIVSWTQLVKDNVPNNWSPELIWIALPFALKLMMLCYLDTLLTSLVVDKKMTKQFGREEQTKQNKELAAQGVANSAIAMVGGIPGAQATIRSVLILNEGATWRLAGVAVGVFVLVEMLIFQEYIGLIPSAVFVGILFKVGYDVFDWTPVVIYSKKLIGKTDKTLAFDVTHADMLFIVGTTAVTVFHDLNTAVILFTILFFAARLLKLVVPDLPEVADNEEQDDNDQDATDKDTTA